MPFSPTVTFPVVGSCETKTVLAALGDPAAVKA
jgi:hypothetical protein